MIRRVVSTVTLSVALTSCAKLGIGGAEKKEEPSPFGPTGIPPQLRAKTPEGGSPVTPGGNVPATPPPSAFVPSEDIVYTDPDNPEAAIPELSTLLSAPKRGPWEDSETIARQRSIREGKPMLIWFTNSQSSPMCKAISQDLFSTNDFGIWATENLVRLRVDDYVKITEPDLSVGEAEDRRLRVIAYNAALKKRYKVMGYPSLIMVSPSGEVTGTYRGYQRGDAEFRWGQLKQAHAVSMESYKGWRAGLEKKGYREWADRRGRKIFAKLLSYSDGDLTLVEPDGGRARTKESSLSEKDRAWIAGQKKLRSL